MQRLFLLLFFIKVFGPIESISDIERILQNGNDQLTARMFSEVARINKGRSMVISAFSALTPLAQLALASEGPSHDELLNAVGFPDDKTIIAVFSIINHKLRTIKGVELKMASKLYIPLGYQVKEKFTKVSRFVFHSAIANVDFADKTNTAREINAWVEKQTNHRIRNLVQPESLNSGTLGLYVNALYFKGEWKFPFEEQRTNSRIFYVNNFRTLEIPFMHQTQNYNYGESNELNAKILELPYAGGQSSLVVVLPNVIEGIEDLINKLRDPFTLNNEIRNTKSNVKVNVAIPKFRTETTTDLKEVLKAMNVIKIFGKDANLTKLLKSDAVFYISGAVHKVFIDINEKGTEAAAVNKFILLGTSLHSAPPVNNFIADHPFVYLLRDNNDILFSGVFYGS